MQTETTSNKRQSALSPDGLGIGQSATDKLGFYGATPVVQPTSASQAAVVYTAGIGTASATSGLQALTGTFNSTLISNALVTLAAQGNAMRAALVSLGIITGS